MLRAGKNDSSLQLIFDVFSKLHSLGYLAECHKLACDEFDHIKQDFEEILYCILDGFRCYKQYQFYCGYLKLGLEVHFIDLNQNDTEKQRETLNCPGQPITDMDSFLKRQEAIRPRNDHMGGHISRLLDEKAGAVMVILGSGHQNILSIDVIPSLANFLGVQRWIPSFIFINKFIEKYGVNYRGPGIDRIVVNEQLTADDIFQHMSADSSTLNCTSKEYLFSTDDSDVSSRATEIECFTNELAAILTQFNNMFSLIVQHPNRVCLLGIYDALLGRACRPLQFSFNFSPYQVQCLVKNAQLDDYIGRDHELMAVPCLARVGGCQLWYSAPETHKAESGNFLRSLTGL